MLGCLTSSISDQESPAPYVYPEKGFILQTISMMPRMRLYVMVMARVETDLQTASILLLPSPASVSQLRNMHSPSGCLSSSSSEKLLYLAVYNTGTNIRIMVATITRMTQPLRNTAMRETDNTLNRQAGRNTQIFLMIALMP